MKPYVPVFFLVMITAMAACSGLRVSQDYDPATEFSGLRTYDWHPDLEEPREDSRINSPFIDSRVRSAVDRVLSDKGYQRAADGNIDLLVRYRFEIRSRIASDNVRTSVGFGSGGWGSWGGIGFSTGGGVREYDEGILVIDVLDFHGDTLLWRGTGTRPVSEHTGPDRSNREINEMVDKILAQFPPKP
ncbi:MAG: DUF4136 domain-containing protein [Deltaproteobacteria bacterium]|nr:DUF4136 domain-containing protein [Deltaproteobacteria bacterium]MBW2285956.1 DUF4136 domain-containing protein [Deltaproteobacteria bacterium]